MQLVPHLNPITDAQGREPCPGDQLSILPNPQPGSSFRPLVPSGPRCLWLCNQPGPEHPADPAQQSCCHCWRQIFPSERAHFLPKSRRTDLPLCSHTPTMDTSLSPGGPAGPSENLQLSRADTGEPLGEHLLGLLPHQGHLSGRITPGPHLRSSARENQTSGAN